jgi:hypothetical protein
MSRSSRGNTQCIPDHFAAALRTARAIQAADRLALGEFSEVSGTWWSTEPAQRSVRTH